MILDITTVVMVSEIGVNLKRNHCLAEFCRMQCYKKKIAKTWGIPSENLEIIEFYTLSRLS